MSKEVGKELIDDLDGVLNILFNFIGFALNELFKVSYEKNKTSLTPLRLLKNTLVLPIISVLAIIITGFLMFLFPLYIFTILHCKIRRKLRKPRICKYCGFERHDGNIFKTKQILECTNCRSQKVSIGKSYYNSITYSCSDCHDNILEKRNSRLTNPKFIQKYGNACNCCGNTQ